MTGSTRGLGWAFAQELGRHGARVVLNGRDPQACAAACARLVQTGVDAVFVPGSVAADGVADRLVATCREQFGGIDLLVNNAGLVRDRTLLRMTQEDFDEVVTVHLRGTWSASRAAAAAMRDRGGAILNIVSGSALYGLVGQSNYAAAKGGMLALTRALSVELARYGIRVNALYPVARTDMTRDVIDAAGPDTLALFGPPEQVAPIVSYLASDEAKGMTGQLLSFDGRDLTVWSHPAPMSTASLERPWTLADVRAAFNDGRLAPEPLHPDKIGRTARELLAAVPIPRAN